MKKARQELKIGAYDWKFREVKRMPKDTLGECDYKSLTIRIAKNIPSDIKRVTIIHELFHAFISSSGLDLADEELVVDSLANQLALFIRVNPDFFQDEIL
jgi:Zn-dependent peptidase ImmA (M78 family)